MGRPKARCFWGCLNHEDPLKVNAIVNQKAVLSYIACVCSSFPSQGESSSRVAMGRVNRPDLPLVVASTANFRVPKVRIV